MLRAFCAVFSIVSGVVAQNHIPEPLRIPFNTNTTPGLSTDIDGPWPTVHLTYRPNSLGLDCYLTLWNHSIFVPPQSCVNAPKTADLQPGSYNTEVQPFPCNLTLPLFYKPSRAFDENSSKAFNLSSDYDEIWVRGQTLFGPLNITGTAKWTLDNLTGFGSNQTLPNASILVATNLTHHFSGASNSSSSMKLPLLFPSLSLWGNATTQRSGWSNPAGGADYSGRNLLPYLFQANQIPSSSFGLHMGSVDPYVAGSLILGGYDRSRILGPLHVYNSYDSLLLINIGIGVDKGYLPLDQLSETDGSYLQGPALRPLTVSGTNFGQNIDLDPGVPYMYLPRIWCDAIASKVDLIYDSRQNLYVWANQTVIDALLNSTSFLFFQFGSEDLDDVLNPVISVTINVSFALLIKRFSISAPQESGDSLMAGSRYFPCSPLPDDMNGQLSVPSPVLGRSFLQSAFFGMNFHTGQSMLAQAPGPANLPDIGNMVTIDPQVRMVSMLNASAFDAWSNSWAGLLPISTINSDGSVMGAQTKHLSSQRGKTGVGVSLGTVFILSVVVVCGVLLRRHRRHKETTRLEMLEEDALARDYEKWRLEQVHRIPETSCPSEDTEREEENRPLLTSQHQPDDIDI